jgi:hypothetical protein
MKLFNITIYETIIWNIQLTTHKILNCNLQYKYILYIYTQIKLHSVTQFSKPFTYITQKCEMLKYKQNENQAASY